MFASSVISHMRARRSCSSQLDHLAVCLSCAIVAEASSQPGAMQAAACGRWLCERQTLMKADKHHKPVGSEESAGQESISYTQVCTVSHSDIHLEDPAPLRSVGYKRLRAA